MIYCASSFIGRQSQSRNCYEIIGFIKEAGHHIREHSRVIEENFREHFHDNICTVTFCNASNMAFMSNPRPSSVRCS